MDKINQALKLSPEERDLFLKYCCWIQRETSQFRINSLITFGRTKIPKNM